MTNTYQLRTPRLTLIGVDQALLRAEIESKEALASVLDSIVPTAWPPEHHDRETIDWALKSLDSLGPNDPWRMFYIVINAPRTLVGTCGFSQAPDTNGCVDIGYSVLEQFQRLGIASEAVIGLMQAAFHAGAAEVAAETYPSLIPSLRVMEKCGMSKIGEGSAPNVVRYSKRL